MFYLKCALYKNIYKEYAKIYKLILFKILIWQRNIKNDFKIPNLWENFLG